MPSVIRFDRAMVWDALQEEVVLLSSDELCPRAVAIGDSADRTGNGGVSLGFTQAGLGA